MAGMWAWLGGLVLNVIALANDGGSAGLDGDMVGLYIASQALMAIGLVASAHGALVTSILTTRAPGMTMRRVPFFSWSALVFGLGLILVLPVLVGTLIYLFVDHRYGSREAFGGNLGTLAWAGWAVTQPATFLYAIPAVGVFADLLPSGRLRQAHPGARRHDRRARAHRRGRSRRHHPAEHPEPADAGRGHRQSTSSATSSGTSCRSPCSTRCRCSVRCSCS